MTQVDLVAELREPVDPQRDAPQHPAVGEAGVVGVVGGDVLEVAGDRVEPQTSGPGHVAEADRAPPRERPLAVIHNPILPACTATG